MFLLTSLSVRTNKRLKGNRCNRTVTAIAKINEVDRARSCIPLHRPASEVGLSGAIHHVHLQIPSSKISNELTPLILWR